MKYINDFSLSIRLLFIGRTTDSPYQKWLAKMRFTYVFVMTTLLTGCATYAHERTPEYERAYAECQLESRKVGGNDTGERWANQLFFHIECMKLKGY